MLRLSSFLTIYQPQGVPQFGDSESTQCCRHKRSAHSIHNMMFPNGCCGSNRSKRAVLSS
eukprot:3332246-Amphidinium_carterae.1